MKHIYQVRGIPIMDNIGKTRNSLHKTIERHWSDINYKYDNEVGQFKQNDIEEAKLYVFAIVYKSLDAMEYTSNTVMVWNITPVWLALEFSTLILNTIQMN